MPRYSLVAVRLLTLAVVLTAVRAVAQTAVPDDVCRPICDLWLGGPFVDGRQTGTTAGGPGRPERAPVASDGSIRVPAFDYLPWLDPALSASATEPPPARPKALMPLYVAYGALATGGFVTTRIGLSSGAFESNPYMKFNKNPAFQAGVAIAVGILTIWLAEYLWKNGSPVRAVVTMALVDALNGVVLWNNVDWLRRH